MCHILRLESCDLFVNNVKQDKMFYSVVRREAYQKLITGLRPVYKNPVAN